MRKFYIQHFEDGSIEKKCSQTDKDKSTNIRDKWTRIVQNIEQIHS